MKRTHFFYAFALSLSVLAQVAAGQNKTSHEIVTVEGTLYPESELPFKRQNHLVLTQSGICIGFFLANSDIVYGVKTGLPVGYIAADGYLYFSFPTK